MPGGAFLPPLTPFQGADGSDVLGSFLFYSKISVASDHIQRMFFKFK